MHMLGGGKKENRLTTDDLTYLRRESLQTVLLCLVVGLYVWYLVLFRPVLARNLVRSRLSNPGRLKRPAGNHDVSHSELKRR
jgi:hypothetical protein